MKATLSQKLLSEFLGTALLLAVVIGSGIMGERLAGGNVADCVAGQHPGHGRRASHVNSSKSWEPVGGAHFNPAVSLTMACRGKLPWSMLAPYVASQLAGAMLGAWLAHAMFDLAILQFSTKVRAGTGQWVAEAVATFGLLLVILRAPASRVAGMVAAYIGAAYWFTASTSFANPAAAFGRMFSDTFAGIAPSSAPAFVIAQLAGAGLAVGAHHLLGTAGNATSAQEAVPADGGLSPQAARAKIPINRR